MNSPASSPISQRTVLIVDDTTQNLTILGELLQPTYRVRAANSGERALQDCDIDTALLALRTHLSAISLDKPSPP